MPSGPNGFCETGAGGQDARCFERPDGGYECYCPNVEEPVMRVEQDCYGALARACSADCDNEAGHCTARDNSQYQCECGIGIGGLVQAPLCEQALRAWCEPTCENERGECYWQPDGSVSSHRLQGATIACRCDGDEELHVSTVDSGSAAGAGAPPNPIVPDQECQTRLAHYCGT